jgi:hypothetical protein
VCVGGCRYVVVLPAVCRFGLFFSPQDFLSLVFGDPLMRRSCLAASFLLLLSIVQNSPRLSRRCLEVWP